MIKFLLLQVDGPDVTPVEAVRDEAVDNKLHFEVECVNVKKKQFA